MKLGVYQKALPKGTLRENIKKAKEIGFDGLEITVDGLNLKPYDMTEEDYQDGISAFEEYKVKPMSVALSATRYFGMACKNKHLRDFSIELTKKSIEMAGRFHMDNILIAGYDSYNMKPNDQNVELFCDAVKQVIPTAEKWHVNLAMENVDIFIRSPKESKDMIDRIDHSIFGGYLDFANCYACGYDPLEMIEVLNERIKCIHIKACSKGLLNSNLPLQESEVSYEEIFKKLGEIGFNGNAVIENWYEKETDVDRQKKNIDYLRNLIAKYIE